MTKKDYINIAKILKCHRSYTRFDLLVEDFCSLLSFDNKKFNRKIFNEAAGRTDD